MIWRFYRIPIDKIASAARSVPVTRSYTIEIRTPWFWLFCRKRYVFDIKPNVAIATTTSEDHLQPNKPTAALSTDTRYFRHRLPSNSKVVIVIPLPWWIEIGKHRFEQIEDFVAVPASAKGFVEFLSAADGKPHDAGEFIVVNESLFTVRSQTDNSIVTTVKAPCSGYLISLQLHGGPNSKLVEPDSIVLIIGIAKPVKH